MNGVGSVRRKRWAAGAALGAVLALGSAGCGSDGTAEVSPRGACLVEEGEPIPVGCLPELVGKIAGVVFAPGGVFASAESQSWFASLGIVSKAYALFSFLEPVGIGVEVALSEVTELDAADGSIDNLIPIVQFAHTDADGVYEIDSRAAEQIDRCRLIVSVGSKRTGDLTRSFVYANNVNIDPASEAVVRLLLKRIHQTDLQLCDFPPEGLRLIVREAEKAASQVTGPTDPAEKEDPMAFANAMAFDRVSRDCDVLELIEAVTQVSFDPPIRRTNRGDCEVNL